MADSYRSYMQHLAQDERLLKAHGFDAWPDADETFRFACDAADSVYALANALRIQLIRDVRGRWLAIPLGKKR